MSEFNWGIIGTGWIASEMAESLNKLYGDIYGVTARDNDKLVDFAEKYQVANHFSSIDEMLADENVDIIYVATPHHIHPEIIERSLLAGKHVLCEKAITINSVELKALVQLAKSKNLILMEAMTIFHMPLFKKLLAEVEAGLLGKVHLVQANFGSHKEYDVTNRFFNPELAGGALLDIGGYAISATRLFLNEQPQKLQTTVNYFETGVDEESVTLLKNDSGQLASVNLTMQSKQPKRILVAGEKGYLEVYDFPRGDKATFTETSSGEVMKIEAGETSKALIYEILDFESFINNNDLDGAIGLTVEVMEILDAIRAQWGFSYPFE